MTGSRDSTARVWDIRTARSVMTLAGHQGRRRARDDAIDPQVVTGSMDSTVRLWDLAAGKQA